MLMLLLHRPLTCTPHRTGLRRSLRRLWHTPLDVLTAASAGNPLLTDSAGMPLQRLWHASKDLAVESKTINCSARSSFVTLRIIERRLTLEANFDPGFMISDLELH